MGQKTNPLTSTGRPQICSCLGFIDEEKNSLYREGDLFNMILLKVWGLNLHHLQNLRTPSAEWMKGSCPHHNWNFQYSADDIWLYLRLFLYFSHIRVSMNQIIHKLFPIIFITAHMLESWLTMFILPEYHIAS